MDDALLYQKSNYQQRRDSLFFLNKYSSKIKWQKGCNRIIDIGCGDGSVTNILKKQIPPGCQYKILGIDRSSNMVKYANNHNEDKDSSFMVFDIENDLGVDLRGNFDHVFSFYALHWIRNQKGVFSKIFNLLDNGGDCFMICVAWGDVYDIYRILQQKNKWSSVLSGIERYVTPYQHVQEPDKVLRKIMEDIGFINIVVEYEDKMFVYENTAMAKNAFQAIFPITVPEDMRADLMEDHMKLATEHGMKHSLEEEKRETIKLSYRLLIAYPQKPDLRREHTKL